MARSRSETYCMARMLDPVQMDLSYLKDRSLAFGNTLASSSGHDTDPHFHVVLSSPLRPWTKMMLRLC